MLRLFITLLLFALIQPLFSQSFELQPEHKAYIYHTVKKSPFFDRNLGRYFEYKGPEIRLPNGNLHYDSIEVLIAEDPDRLLILSQSLRHAPVGVLTDLSNKTALWILNRTLFQHRQNELDEFGKLALEQYFSDLHENLPSAAFLKQQSGESKPYPLIEKLLNPGLNISDKLAMLNGIQSMNLADKKAVITAIDYATANFVARHTELIFNVLTDGYSVSFTANQLVAVGDGVNLSSAFEEREKDERSRWISGLPKSLGFFPYQLSLKDGTKTEKSKIETQDHAIFQYETAGLGMPTVISANVWGYDKEKQTTVVIDKGGKQYVLFGNTQNRFLSPDSVFSEGLTYYTLINRLQHEVDEIEKLITGRRGIDYWLGYYEKKKTGKLLQIDKIEKEINDLRMVPITTTTKGKKKKKKLVAESNQKKRHPKQEAFIQYNLELAEIRKRIKEYEKLKEEALHEQQIKIQRIKWMNDLIGTKWVTYKESNGLYAFDDGTTFDLYNQQLVFPPSDNPEVFEVRVLAIPALTENDQVDEVVLHVSVIDVAPNFDAPLNLTLLDKIGTNAVNLAENLLTDYDSLSIRIFLEGLLDKKKPVEFRLLAGGAGKWNGSMTVKLNEPAYLSQYPGKNPDEQKQSQTSDENTRLRTVQIAGRSNRDIVLEINSFTDLVETLPPVFSSRIAKQALKNKWSNNDLLTAFRTAWAFEQCVLELKQIATEIMDPDEAKKIVALLDKSLKKAKIDIGEKRVKISSFASVDE